jgi:hypothetical protein
MKLLCVKGAAVGFAFFMSPRLLDDEALATRLADIERQLAAAVHAQQWRQPSLDHSASVQIAALQARLAEVGQRNAQLVREVEEVRQIVPPRLSISGPINQRPLVEDESKKLMRQMVQQHEDLMRQLQKNAAAQEARHKCVSRSRSLFASLPLLLQLVAHPM